MDMACMCWDVAYILIIPHDEKHAMHWIGYDVGIGLEPVAVSVLPELAVQEVKIM